MANAILILYEFIFATLERMVLAKRNSNHLINWQSNDRCKSAQKNFYITTQNAKNNGLK